MKTTRAISHSDITELTNYKPDVGLQRIAVAEAAERHFARAKDHKALSQAVQKKLEAQRTYILWRDSVVPAVKRGNAGPGRGKQIAVPKFVLPDADPGHLVAHRWRKRLKDDKNYGKALADAEVRCIRVCEQENVNTVRGTEGTGEFERYTPAEYIDAVRQVLGEIDLDPASSNTAQKIVKAVTYYTSKDDGLNRDWQGKVFLNPPYHRDLCPRFIDKLLDEINEERVTEAILLTNNSTDTDWFNLAVRLCNSLCFVKGRIKFFEGDGETEVLPTQGQAFFYFGSNVKQFERTFRYVGFCVRVTVAYEK